VPRPRGVFEVAVGDLDDPAEDVEEAVDTDVVAGSFERPAHVELQVLGEKRRQNVAVLVEDRLGHPVHGHDVGVLAHRVSLRWLCGRCDRT
jgi:hypothetical protein